MAIVAKFDLETIQLNAVNAFVHCHLDEIVYMRPPPYYIFHEGNNTDGSRRTPSTMPSVTPNSRRALGVRVSNSTDQENKISRSGCVTKAHTNRILRLNKALYGLRRSPYLWQKDLTTTFLTLQYSPIPQEQCIVIKDRVIVFYFVDDMIIYFKATDRPQAMKLIDNLMKRYTMKILGELEWFLGIYVIRDRAKKLLWLSQEAYIDKIANQFVKPLDRRLPDTPMASTSISSIAADGTTETPPSQTFIYLYQQKVGSILFYAVNTRVDVAFAASRLGR